MDGRGQYVSVPINKVALIQRGSVDESVFPIIGKGSLPRKFSRGSS